MLSLKRRTLVATTIVATVVVFVMGSLVVWVTTTPATTVLPNTFVGGLPIGGLKTQELASALQRRYDEFALAGIDLVWMGREAHLLPTLSAQEDPDLSYDMIRFDAQETARRVANGQQSARGRNMLRKRVGTLLASTVVSPAITVDQDRLDSFLQDAFQSSVVSARNAHWKVEEGALAIEPERRGLKPDTEALANILDHRLNLWSFPTRLNITTVEETPSITANQLEQRRNDVEALRARFPLTLRSEKQQWVVTADELLPLLDPSMAISPDTEVPWLTTIASAVRQRAVNAQFELKNGRVTVFAPEEAGYLLDAPATIAAINAALSTVASSMTVDIVTVKESASVTIASLNTLGIKELLGRGTSNFTGSPKNRRHNIAVGAKALHGIIVPAGEEFSLLRALGPIEASTGYLPELVIKGDRTIPEFGGGLCQIGTTTFRAAMAAGLPITERQNHSYRVVYYEPAGTDATIYPPRPDFRFVNDTGNAILFVAKIVGDDLVFELWGTNDRRQARRTQPRIYNIRKPPSTKIIATQELKPGQKKCTERAHDGADAEFTYAVTMPNGEVREKIFRSHYRPWQAVCLVGAELTAASPAASDDATLLPPPDVPTRE